MFSTSKTTVRKHHSETTRTPSTPFPAHTAKRQSIASLPTKSTLDKTASHQRPPVIWRSPGHCEIPNILGNAYLQPMCSESPKKQTQTGPPRPPWYPACATAHWIPAPPAPLTLPDECAFEKRLKKAIPKLSLVNAPKARYSTSKEIGTGVNGSVVQVFVRSTNNGVRFALKRCKLDHDREYRAALVRELRIMATGHTNLIRLREAAVFKSEVWMAMDLMRCSVFAVLCVRGLPEEYAVYIVQETLNALVFLHSKGFIHRDVKCENLLLGPSGEVKLADFGLATSSRHVNKERLGTTKWMAPEVVREQTYTEKVDLWSLGITLIEMMDRVPPHYATKEDEAVFELILEEPSPTFTYSYPSVYCTGLVAWLLEGNPENRPSAKDAAAEVDTHIHQDLLKTVTAQELANFVSKTLQQ